MRTHAGRAAAGRPSGPGSQPRRGLAARRGVGAPATSSAGSAEGVGGSACDQSHPRSRRVSGGDGNRSGETCRIG